MVVWLAAQTVACWAVLMVGHWAGWTAESTAEMKAVLKAANLDGCWVAQKAVR